ncbi:hypothetical protein D5281_11615 [bacterium 1xD42-62]|uniref:Uncharacterized protein n=1 Tax=Parablautia muri TaxID=2320879 RepID=A0A9X5BFX4_9FIRM|nr:hypothetical protein [Parablautia muri]
MTLFYFREKMRYKALTEKKIREIKFEKGASFTAKFINKFCEEWDSVVKQIRSSGRKLDAIAIVKR